MKTLTRGAKKLREETILNAEPGENGDRFWERPFNAEQSIERCQHLEQRGTEFKVKCGLEFCHAKLSLDHGEWYPHLYRAEIEPSKAQKRMQVARDFMQWAGVTDVVQAIELAYTKSSKLRDFANSKQINLNEFLDKGYHPPGTGTKQHILSVSLKEVRQLWGRIEDAVVHDYRNWRAEERDEVKQTLRLFSDESLRVISDIEQLEQMSPKEQIRGMGRKYYKHQAELSDTPERKERVIQSLRRKENEQNSEAIEKIIAGLEQGRYD